MDKRRKFFIHPGYPKTASTTLQKALFSKHPDLCYLGKPLTGDVLDIEVAILDLDDALFTQALPGLQQKFLSVIARCDESGRNVLLSHEGFLRPTRYQGHDLQRTATRIRQVFCEPVQDEFDCHVLLTIRKQVDIIPSYFFLPYRATRRISGNLSGQHCESPVRATLVHCSTMKWCVTMPACLGGIA